MTHRALALLGAAVLLAAPALAAAEEAADAADADGIMVERPWARASAPAARAGAAFMTLRTEGSAGDTLIGVATPAAAAAELHTHEIDNGIVRMREVEGIAVAPGAPTVLGPGGLHVMLIGLEAPLREGERFPLELTFERAGTVEVSVAVEAATAMAPGAGPTAAGQGDPHAADTAHPH